MSKRTSQITLRPIHLSDIDDFMAWAADDRVTRFCTWETYTSRDQALEFLTNNAIPHPWFRAVCLDNRAIGSVSVTPGGDSCRAEIGYVVVYEHWGRGFATRAVETAAAAVFGEWPELERVEAFVDVENEGSQRVVEKAGFVREGVLRKYVRVKGRCRDMVVFSLLSSDLRLHS